jgi:predicted metalloprotease with PDZ domain
VYAALSAVVPADWRQIIRRHLDTTGPEALLAGLESTGWQLSYSAVKNSYLEVDQRRRKTTNRLWSIGLLLDKDDTVVDTVEDRAAARAGIGPGMKLIAVNGRRFTAEVLDEALVTAHDSRKPMELLVENGDFYRTVSVPYFDGPRWPHITPLPGEKDVLAEVLRPRTH